MCRASAARDSRAFRKSSVDLAAPLFRNPVAKDSEVPFVFAKLAEPRVIPKSSSIIQTCADADQVVAELLGNDLEEDDRFGL